ncbi:MAG: enoyl-CoA hydratase-related protein [Pseudomonadota bacterium]
MRAELLPPTITSAQAGAVLRLSLNRPNAANAMSDDMVVGLTNALQAAAADSNLRVIVLSGNGRSFCAGGDLNGFLARVDAGASASDIAAMNRQYGTLMQQLSEQPQVTITCVHGAVYGGGVGLACASDITIAADDARFRLSETSLGIVPAQIAPFVADRIGPSEARRLMLTGTVIDASDGYRLGLVHERVADAKELTASCDRVIDNVLTCAPNANAATKSLLRQSQALARDELLDVAAAKFAACLASDEGREGVLAFTEKRAPSWRGVKRST